MDIGKEDNKEYQEIPPNDEDNIRTIAKNQHTSKNTSKEIQVLGEKFPPYRRIDIPNRIDNECINTRWK